MFGRNRVALPIDQELEIWDERKDERLVET